MPGRGKPAGGGASVARICAGCRDRWRPPGVDRAPHQRMRGGFPLAALPRKRARSERREQDRFCRRCCPGGGSVAQNRD